MIGSQLLQCFLFLTFSLSCQNKNKLKLWIALVPLSWHLYFLSNGFGRLSNQQRLSLNPAIYSLFLLYRFQPGTVCCGRLFLADCHQCGDCLVPTGKQETQSCTWWHRLLCTSPQRARGERVEDRQISYKMSRNCVGWFAVLCLCHTGVGEDKSCTTELQSSSLSHFELAEIAG